VRKAGAILLGKTNTPEFTLGGLAGISTASNLLYGLSHNPYDLLVARAVPRVAPVRSCGGRRAFDIGSDWGGSIRGPAHNNGVAGINRPACVCTTGHIVDYGRDSSDALAAARPLCRRWRTRPRSPPIFSGPDCRDTVVVGRTAD